jgi:biopolymer transport protein ExbD
MNLEQYTENEDVAIDMSPMIDMVFLLLIFFVVASVVVEDKVKVAIPSAFYAKVPEDITGRLVVSINQQEDLFIGTRKISMEELEKVLATEMEVNPKLRVMIRADGEVQYEVNEKVMEACAEAGAVDLIYSAFEQ